MVRGPGTGVVALVALLCLCAPAATLAGPAPIGTLGVGLPGPLRSLGYDTRGEAVRGASPRVPLHLELALGVDGLADGWMRVELIASSNLVMGRQASADSSARWWVVGLAPKLTWRATERVVVHVGPALAALKFALIVDDNLRLDTASIGGGAAAGVETAVSATTHVGVRVSSWWFGPPLVRDTWFNERLGSTHLVTVNVGVAWTRAR